MGPAVVLIGAGLAFAGWYIFIRKPASHGGGQPAGVTLTPLPPGSPGLDNLKVNYVVPGGDYIVATHDTGASGQLTARATPAGAILGSFAHGDMVHYVEGPDGSGKWIKVAGTNAANGQPLTGWVATEYITG